MTADRVFNVLYILIDSVSLSTGKVSSCFVRVQMSGCNAIPRSISSVIQFEIWRVRITLFQKICFGNRRVIPFEMNGRSWQIGCVSCKEEYHLWFRLSWAALRPKRLTWLFQLCYRLKLKHTFGVTSGVEKNLKYEILLDWQNRKLRLCTLCRNFEIYFSEWMFMRSFGIQ